MPVNCWKTCFLTTPKWNIRSIHKIQIAMEHEHMPNLKDYFLIYSKFHKRKFLTRHASLHTFFIFLAGTHVTASLPFYFCWAFFIVYIREKKKTILNTSQIYKRVSIKISVRVIRFFNIFSVYFLEANTDFLMMTISLWHTDSANIMFSFIYVRKM